MLTGTLTRHRPRVALTAVVVASGALAIQAGHLLEHVLQLGYWLAHPTDAPWMSPWGAALAHVLSIGGDHVLGMELLHLFGNLTFLAGLAALVVVCWAAGTRLRAAPNLRAALLIQTLHVAEHVALTASVALTGQAAGVSTALGLADGPVLYTWRIWFHILVNLAASWFAAVHVADRGGIVTPRQRQFRSREPG